MNRQNWIRRAAAAAALTGAATLIALLSTHSGAFAADDGAGAAPAPPPAAAPEPPGPPPAPNANDPAPPPPPRGDFRGQDGGMPPPPPRDGEYGGRFQTRRGDDGAWDRQGPPPPPEDFRGQEGWGASDRQGPPRSFGVFTGPGPERRMRFHAEFAGPPPGGAGFRGEARGMKDGQDGQCPRREGFGPRQGGRQDGFEPPRPPDPDNLFNNMDRDRDGKLSKEEFRSLAEQFGPPRPPMNGGSDDRRPAPPQRPFPQDDRPER